MFQFRVVAATPRSFSLRSPDRCFATAVRREQLHLATAYNSRVIVRGVEVLFHSDAEAELAALPEEERVAIDHAREKLEAMGARLPFPHQSDVRGAVSLRELRPRGGRSPWRALYRQIGDAMVIGGIGPEANVDRRGFNRAVRRAGQRLDSLEADERGTQR